jgi:hypothetical protein
LRVQGRRPETGQPERHGAGHACEKAPARCHVGGSVYEIGHVTLHLFICVRPSCTCVVDDAVLLPVARVKYDRPTPSPEFRPQSQAGNGRPGLSEPLRLSVFLALPKPFYS